MIQNLICRLESGFAQRAGLNLLLYPLSLLYGAVIFLRRNIYLCVAKWTPKEKRSLAVPVVIFGNIYVGGTGKTPLLMAMVTHLQERGFKPGVISRGYFPDQPKEVTPSSARLLSLHDSVDEVGDEPRLIALQTGAPIAVGRNRRASAQLLIDAGCDIVLSDDGLQHYALPRDLEIVVVDAQRGHGNGWLLPAGPLREPLRRLKTVDWVVYQGGSQPENSFVLAPTHCRSLGASSAKTPFSSWRGREVHAVAGIGHPDRFFNMLREHGLTVHAHPFPDHHRYELNDLNFGDELPVLMTPKDAVKCRSFEQLHLWVVEVEFKAHSSFYAHFDQLLDQKSIAPPSTL